MAIKNIFKKKEAPVVEEKKPVSLTQMKIKYGIFSKKTDEFIKKYEGLIEKKVKRATELKLKGQNAAIEIKDITRYKNKIMGLEKRRSIFERQIDNMEELEMQQGFLALIGDMANMMGESYFDVDQVAKVNDEIIEKTLKLGDQQRLLESKMEELDSAMDSYDALTTSDLSSEEANINATIDRLIADARFDENVSAETIASRASSSILVDN